MLQTVLLLPGLGSPAFTMKPLAAKLREHGFAARIIPYSASKSSFSEVVETVAEEIDARYDEGRVHLLGHSMGGLVARALAAGGLKRTEVRRIVMVGTPLLGSGAAKKLAGWPIGKLPFGRIWEDLSPEKCAENALPVKGVEIGMIAGSLPAADVLFGEETDGVVTVSATRADSLKSHITINAVHSSLLITDAVADAAAEFFQKGTMTQPE